MSTADITRFLRRVRSPRSWAIGTRRAFMLTLPLAVPIWLMLMMSVALMIELRSFAECLVRFWTAAPRIRVSRYGCSSETEDPESLLVPHPMFRVASSPSFTCPAAAGRPAPLPRPSNDLQPLEQAGIPDIKPQESAEAVRIKVWNWADNRPLDLAR